MRGVKNTGTAYHQSPEFKASIHERDGERCQLCGCGIGQVCDLHWSSVTQLDVAHIIPWLVSHDTTPANVRLLCHPCNKREGTGTAGQPAFTR